MALKVIGQRFDRLINACRNHKKVSYSMGNFVSILVNIINRVEYPSITNPEDKGKKIGVVCIFKVFEKLNNLVQICNVYLYKCSKVDYDVECIKIQNLFNKVSSNLKRVEFDVAESIKNQKDNCRKHLTIKGVENIISSAFISLEKIVSEMKEKKEKEANDKLVSSILDYFDNTYPEDKEFIYEFIDN